jgi:aryl-alcohol dehydrogenase-like predicted oxidoreductase
MDPLLQMSPRFVAENLEKNEVLREQLAKIVAKKKCSMNQLALAWVLHKGKDVVPIPGTTKTANLESNVRALGVSLSEEEMKEIDAAAPIGVVAGSRYPAQHLHHTYPYAQTPPISSWKGVEG